MEMDYESKCSAEKNAGRDRQGFGVCREHELIGGKPPVVK
jgi:hypothetical protein